MSFDKIAYLFKGCLESLLPGEFADGMRGEGD